MSKSYFSGGNLAKKDSPIKKDMGTRRYGIDKLHIHEKIHTTSVAGKRV
jgi:hypothetical protein